MVESKLFCLNIKFEIFTYLGNFHLDIGPKAATKGRKSFRAILPFKNHFKHKNNIIKVHRWKQERKIPHFKLGLQPKWRNSTIQTLFQPKCRDSSIW